MGIAFDQFPAIFNSIFGWLMNRKLFLTALLNLRKPPSLQVVMF